MPTAVRGTDRDVFVETPPPDQSFTRRIGGRGNDHGRGLAIDGERNILVAGTSLSPDWPVRNGLQWRRLGADDAVILKLRPTR